VKVQSFLENKIVHQKLIDYGRVVRGGEGEGRGDERAGLASAASLTDRAAAGADDGLGLLIGLAILIILIIVILKLSNKEVIIR